MKSRIVVLSLILCSVIALTLQAQILWDEDGVAIRQGKHIEWYRSADSDGSGYLFVTWSDCRTGTRDIYAQKFDTGGNALWVAGGVHVVEAPGRQEDPVIVADGAGGAVIAWVDVVADPKCRAYCQRIDSDGNLLWPADGVVVNENVSTHSPVNICSDGSGGAIITWKDVRSDEVGDIYIVRLTSEGNVAPGWTRDGQVICSAPGEQSGTSIGSDGSGGAIITWKDKRSGTNYDIYVQKVSADGGAQWENGGLPVCSMAVDQDQVKLWSDGSSGAFIAWRDRRSGSYTDIYGQRINGAGEMQWADQGTIICGADGNQEKPRLINDGAGGAIFTWKDHRNNPYDWDLYAQRVNANGIKMWNPDDVPVCTASSDQIEVRLTLVDTGEAVFVWVDQRNEGSPLGDIYAQRINTTGVPQWTPNGETICAADFSQFSPLLRSDTSGGIYAIWGDHRSGSIGIYAQRLNGAGALQWTAEGLAIVRGISGNATHLQMTEGIEGAILVWEDGRRGALGTFAYAQKIGAGGSPQWTVNGTGIDTSALGNQTFPAVTEDGSGGAYFAWEDRRDGIIQIYAQRLNAGGTPHWQQALRVSPTDNDQTDPWIVSDGDGGIVVSWSDLRNDNDYDVYSQRIDSQGQIQWDTQGLRISTSGYDDYAHGIAGDGSGGTFILWQGGSWDNQNIYARKVDMDGTVPAEWTGDGLTLCAASGHQVEPRVIPDGDGGMIIVWEDSRDGAKDIFTQRVSGDGDLLWTVSGADSLNGLPVCQAQNDQSSPYVTGAGQSGCFIAWHDFRTIGNGNDIYLQKLDGAGTAQLESDGAGLAIIDGDQFSPVLISDPEDVIIAVWEDNRSDVTKLDLYAQASDGAGTPLWQTDGTPVVQYHHKQSTPLGMPDGQGGAFVAWEDMRSSGKSETHDIYAQRLQQPSAQLRGDVTNDGNINVLDVLAALNHILDVIPLDAGGQWRADCSGDGAINVLDALGIANVILGLGTCAP